MVTFFKLVGILWALWSPPAGEGAAGAPLLAGPTVSAPKTRPSLVQRDFDGKITRLETEPETAAALRLDLTEQQRAVLDQFLTRRLLALDKLVTGKYSVIVESGAVLQAGKRSTPEDRLELLKAYGALQQALKPWHDRGSLLDEAGTLLTPEQHTTARAMADEYRDAMAKELAKDAHEEASPAQLRVRVSLEETGRLVKQSIQRRADSAQARLDELVMELDLSPEQSEQVRSLFMEYAVGVIQGTREDTMSLRERQTYMASLAKILTPEQRLRLGDLVIAGKTKATGRTMESRRANEAPPPRRPSDAPPAHPEPAAQPTQPMSPDGL